MHSQVSVANAEYFIDEDRLRRDDLDAAGLEAMVEDTDGSIICCNVCGRLKEVEASTSDGDGPTTIDDVVGGGRHD